MNGNVWGVSRELGGSGNNFGQGLFSAWPTTQIQMCDGSTPTVHAPNDIVVCNGQLREAVSDNTDVSTLAMYPKQPFDFAGRAGTIAFDVSNDTQGNHTVWPELWITDQPVPTPFRHFGAFGAGRNSVGIKFGGGLPAFQGHNLAPGCPDDASARWTVDAVVESRNYVVDDSSWGGATQPQILGCATDSTGPGNMNHIEVRISQNLIDVYATDAGTSGPLHHLASVANANLSLTRGLVWLEDAHYNADKGGLHDQRTHTFSWDNFGFDGPVLARDLAYDALDALAPIANYPDLLNHGWNVLPNAVVPLKVPGVTGLQNAAGAVLTFEFYAFNTPTTLSYTVNGHVHSQAWPYAETTPNSIRTLGVPVPLTDIVAGTNTVSISANQQLAVSNVDLVLVGAGGVIPVVPGAPTATAVPATPVPAATATAVPATPVPGATATAVPATTCTIDVRINGVAQPVSRPMSFCTNQ
jgi:hypothetical protein